MRSDPMTLDTKGQGYDIVQTMTIWPPLVLPLDPTGRLAAIQELADSDSPFRDWATAMTEHTAKHLALGWPLHTAMAKAAPECLSHRPPTL